jgi:anaerobic selenocysteine-containing dehydrogenase
VSSDATTSPTTAVEDQARSAGSERTAFVTCVLCEASCGLEVRLRDERIESIRGHDADPLSRGHICP